MRNAKNWYLLGFCAIPIGILAGQMINKWLGIGIIVLGTVFAIVSLFRRPK